MCHVTTTAKHYPPCICINKFIRLLEFLTWINPEQNKMCRAGLERLQVLCSVPRSDCNRDVDVTDAPGCPETKEPNKTETKKAQGP